MRGILTTSEKDCRAIFLARLYLLSFPGVIENVLDEHLSPPKRPRSIEDIYLRAVISAQNFQMAPKVIGDSIGGIEKLRKVLFGFDPKKVHSAYGDDSDSVLEKILLLKPTGKVRTSPRGLWPRFCRTVLSAARFLDRFKNADEFCRWVDDHGRTETRRLALANEIAAEVHGFGFVLACDFLKELGFHSYGKPDVHIQEILFNIGLAPSRNENDIFKAIERIAKNVGQNSYWVDKLFWLIGSGSFYKIGLKIHKPRERERDKFIEFAKKRLVRPSFLTNEKTNHCD